jgi:hypothetical protein
MMRLIIRFMRQLGSIILWSVGSWFVCELVVYSLMSAWLETSLIICVLAVISLAFVSRYNQVQLDLLTIS